jgi:hypothetical protein
MIHAEIDPARWQPLEVAFDASGGGVLRPIPNGFPTPHLPLDHWSADRFLEDSPSMRLMHGGLEVVTAVRQYYFATRYAPLTAGFTGWYHFVLKVKRHRGEFCFGARPANDLMYLATDVFGHGIGREREFAFWVQLEKGQTVLLRTANNDMAGFGAASFEIEQLTAAGVPAQ